MPKILIAAVVLAATLCPRAAHAAPPKWQNEANAETCGSSFEERLANFREAVVEQQRYMREYDRVMPWFHEHCRWLSELELAIRKIDDPAAFVCDTRKARPGELTSEFAVTHQWPREIPVFIEYSAENRWCQAYDAASAISLRLDQIDPSHVQARIVLQVMCWRVESAKCDRVRAALAASE